MIVGRARLLRALGVGCIGVLGPLALPIVTASPAFASVRPGALYAAGLNSSGQLGVGEDTGPQTCSGEPCSNEPVAPALPAGVRSESLAAGGSVAYVVGSDGNLYAWGSNIDGQLGTGLLNGPDQCSAGACSTSAVLVDLPTSAIPVAQVATSGSFTFALGADGKVYGWGYDSQGQLGNGENSPPGSCTGNSCPVPSVIALPGGVSATGIAAGTSTGFALATTGALYAWGFGRFGELGNGASLQPGANSQSVYYPPAAVDLPVTATGVWANAYSVFANGSDGKVYSWGFNGYGQLGHGENSSLDASNQADYDVSTPWLVALPPGVQLQALETTSFYTTYAVGTDGKVYVWGNNVQDFGNGSTQTTSTVPETVTLPNSVLAVSVSAALASGSSIPSVYVEGVDGYLYEWGQSNFGEFADGGQSPESYATPQKNPWLSSVSAVAAGGSLLLLDAVYTNPPTVTSVSPASGPAAGGTSVTVTGTNFTGATAVYFGTNAGTSLSVVSDTSITVTAPAGTGTVDVTVSGTGGTSPANAPADSFTYTAAAPDGSGTMTVLPTSVTAGSTANTLTFTYTAAAGGLSSGEIDVVVPSGWSAPSITNAAPGFTTSTCGGYDISGMTIQTTGVILAGGGTCTITYGAKSAGGPGASAQSASGTATFTTTEMSTSGGVLTALATSPSVTVNPVAPDGSGTMTVLISSANPSVVGQAVTYTASVAPPPGTGGTVTFTQGSTDVPGCVAVAISASTGQAACAITYTAAGTYTVSASYSGTWGFSASTSAPLAEVVGSAAPTVTIGPATSLLAASATLDGTVDPEGTATSFFFQYGTTTSYGQRTPTFITGSGTEAFPVSASVTGLVPGTTYYAELVATSPGGTTDSTDVSFTTPTACAADTGNSDFICSVYQVLFSRAPTASELSNAVASLVKAETPTRTSVADEVLASAEHRNDLLSGYFQTYLGRPVDSSGLASFGGLFASGATDEDVQAAILGSAEYFARAGGTNAGFVAALYRDILNRSPGSAELTSWETALAAGASRGQVAMSFLTSAEYRSDLLSGYFQTYLGRPVDSSGLASFGGLFALGATDEDVQAAVVGSPEFFDGHSSAA